MWGGVAAEEIMHLILDGPCSDIFKLRSEEEVEGFVRDAAAVLGLEIISGPHTVTLDNGKEAGVSCVAIIAESNICVHTWPEYGFINIDFFSCKDVSPVRLEGLAFARFGLHHSTRLMFERGGPKQRKA